MRECLARVTVLREELRGIAMRMNARWIMHDRLDQALVGARAVSPTQRDTRELMPGRRTRRVLLQTSGQ